MKLDQLLAGETWKHSFHSSLKIQKSSYMDEMYITNYGVWLCNIQEINEEEIKVLSYLFDQRVEATILIKDIELC
jgi:hypothetical protein